MKYLIAAHLPSPAGPQDRGLESFLPRPLGVWRVTRMVVGGWSGAAKFSLIRPGLDSFRRDLSSLRPPCKRRLMRINKKTEGTMIRVRQGLVVAIALSTVAFTSTAMAGKHG